MVRKAILIGFVTAVSLIFSAEASAGDAVATNKWMTEIPDGTEMVSGSTVSASFVRIQGGGQTVKRNRKAYMAFYDASGVTYTNKNSTSTVCAPDDTCASAPLFIASETALVCTDGDIGTATADTGNEIQVNLCADSTCTDVSSVKWGVTLTETETTACGVGGSNSGDAQPNIGGQWIYVELIINPGNDEEVLVWVVGQ